MTTQVMGSGKIGSGLSGGASETKKAGSNAKNFEDIIGGSLNSSKGPASQVKKPAKQNSHNGTQGVPSKLKQAVEEKKAYIKGASGNSNSVQDAPKMPDESVLNETEEKIASTVKNSLGITDDRLNELLELLGMTAIDLLNPDNLKQLVLANSQESDLTALLINENLADAYTKLEEEISQLGLEDQFFMTKEELSDFLKTACLKADEQRYALKEGQADLKNPDQMEQQTQETANTDFSIASEKEDSGVGGDEQGAGGFGKKGMDNGTGKGQASLTEQFINNLSQANMNGTKEAGAANMAPSMKEIVNQVVEQIKVAVKPETTTMELQLNPEHLGKVNLSVTAKDGQLTASFLVQNQVTKEALESQIQILRENLESHGLKVEAVEVTVSNFGFEQSGNQNQQEGSKKKPAKKINTDDYLRQPEAAAKEEITPNPVTGHGANVDYTV